MQVRKLLLVGFAFAAASVLGGCVETPATTAAVAQPKPTVIAAVGASAVLPSATAAAGGCLVPSARTDHACGRLVTSAYPLQPGESVRVVEGLPIRQREFAGGNGAPRFQYPDGLWTDGWRPVAEAWEKVLKANPEADPRRNKKVASAG